MRRLVHARPSGDGGMTLAEMLVALMLIVLVFFGMAAASISGFGSVQRSNGQLAANQLANEIIESLRAEAWTDLTRCLNATPGTTVTWTGPPSASCVWPTNVDPYRPQQRGTRTYTPTTTLTWVDSPCNGSATAQTQQDYVRMDVSVSWAIKGGAAKSVSVTSYRSPDGSEKTPTPVPSPSASCV